MYDTDGALDEVARAWPGWSVSVRAYFWLHRGGNEPPHREVVWEVCVVCLEAKPTCHRFTGPTLQVAVDSAIMGPMTGHAVNGLVPDGVRVAE